MIEKKLYVYLCEQLAGILSQNESGSLSFIYDSVFLHQSMHALSLSLPLQTEAFSHDNSKAFFSGLLPDERLRERLAQYLGVSKRNPFALLNAIGGECAGAVSLFPKKKVSPLDDSQNIEVLNEKELANLIQTLNQQPMLAGENNMRLSLAGAHDKLAVTMKAGKIALAKDHSPTTHILKLPIQNLEDTVVNEFFCMQLAKKVGLDTANSQLYYSEGTPYYLVERFDREETNNGKTKRIHQEDFCQAIGAFPEIKYENEGGPSISRCQQIITDASAQPASDQLELIRRIAFNYLIGNADAHGKNFSLLYSKTKPSLSPAYDLLCTTAYPSLTNKMAMKIGGKYDPEALLQRHWERLVPDTRAAKNNLKKTLLSLSEKTLTQSIQLKNELKNKDLSSSTLDQICEVISARSKRLKDLY